MFRNVTIGLGELVKRHLTIPDKPAVARAYPILLWGGCTRFDFTSLQFATIYEVLNLNGSGYNKFSRLE
jgi:hypothetical protein